MFDLPQGFKMESASDISKTIEVPVLTAMLGGQQEVTTISGQKLIAKIPSGITDGTKIRFGGKGLLVNGNQGNMIGIIKLRMPKSLTEDEKALLETLKTHSNFI